MAVITSDVLFQTDTAGKGEDRRTLILLCRLGTGDRAIKARNANNWLQAGFCFQRWAVALETCEAAAVPVSKLNSRGQAPAQSLTQALLSHPTEALTGPHLQPTDKAQLLPAPSMSPFSPDMLCASTWLLPPSCRDTSNPSDLFPLRTCTIVEEKNEENREIAGHKVPIPGKTRSFSISAVAGLGDQPWRLPPSLGCCWEQRARSSPDCAGDCLLCWKETQARDSQRDLRAAFPSPNQYLKLQWEKMATSWYRV